MDAIPAAVADVVKTAQGVDSLFAVIALFVLCVCGGGVAIYYLYTRQKKESDETEKRVTGRDVQIAEIKGDIKAVDERLTRHESDHKDLVVGVYAAIDKVRDQVVELNKDVHKIALDTRETVTLLNERFGSKNK